VPGSDQEYFATKAGDDNDMPTVVMINRGSASASEIVSGALQDHDRALVVGETTFGKALVQSVYRISGAAGLALTTAHYYTPSGRLIQRPWDATFDEYLSYRLKDQDSARPHNPSDLKHTDAGRPVYSGGGIEPDKRVSGPLEGFDPTRFGRMIYNRQEFENYAQKFTAEGDTRIAGPSTGRRTIRRNFVVDDAMVADFREQLKADKIKIDEDAFKKDATFIRAMIRFRIDEVVFGIADARRHLIAVDPQAQAALTEFGAAQKLTELARANTKVGQ
jgi:carboxyl-terminal processing protease